LQATHAILAITHALAAAAWFGAMFYSFLVLHPRAHAYFQRETDFEAFITTVSHGARWKVLSCLGLIGITGVGLMAVHWWQPRQEAWLPLICAKVALLLAAGVLFVYTSWRLWPARVLATVDEIPRFQRVFRWVAAVMMGIAGLGIALGIVAHAF